MEDWFIYGLMSALSAALATIFAKIGLGRVDPLTATALRTIVMTALTLVVFGIYRGASSIGDLTTLELLFIFLSGIMGGISWILYFIALQRGEASKVALLDRSSILFIIVMSILILHEELTVKKAVATCLILAALYLLIA